MTIEEAKNKIAKKYGYSSWSGAENGMRTHISNPDIIEKRMEEVVKLFDIPAVVGRSEQLKCRNVACDNMVDSNSDDVFCEKHKRKLGI